MKNPIIRKMVREAAEESAKNRANMTEEELHSSNLGLVITAVVIFTGLVVLSGFLFL